MSPPFMANRAGRPRGPPPFLVQLLRAPLTINNVVALIVTKSVQHSRRITAIEALANRSDVPNPVGVHHGPGAHHGPPGAHHGPPRAHHGPCAMKGMDFFLGLLSVFFILNIAHNLLTVARMHSIRKSVFGESMCAARRRWRRGEMSEEEQQQCGQKFKEMGKRMPSIFISTADVITSVAFLGIWILTILLSSREGKVELGVGYASVGALVAGIFNFMIGVNGLKLWAKGKRQQKESLASVEEADTFVNEKEQLLAN